MQENRKVPEEKLPKHVAIIMDGNGRWAKQRLLPRSDGHRRGMERVLGLIEKSFAMGINHITLYALSTENLKRPKEEIDSLFDLFRVYFNQYMGRANEAKACFRAIGETALLPSDIQEMLKEAEEKTAHFQGKSLNVAVCYGARGEMIRAVNEAVKAGKQVTESDFARLLYTKDIPDPDLIIRTGNEQRLSNFLLYQAAYAELYFSKKMFPAFSDRDFEKALLNYAGRTRRFGKTDEQITTREN